MATAVLYNLQPNLSLANGTIETYEADGTTPQATYKDNQQASAHDTNIQLDTYGLPPGGSMWLGSNLTYKLIFKDYTGTVIYAVNNVEPGGNTFTAGIQLGGNLDVNGNLITSNPTNPDINITPYGVGRVIVPDLEATSDIQINSGGNILGDGQIHLLGTSFILLPHTRYNSANTTETITGLNPLLNNGYYHDIDIYIGYGSATGGGNMGFSLDFLSTNGTSVSSTYWCRDIYDGSTWSRSRESSTATTQLVVAKSTEGGAGTVSGFANLNLRYHSGGLNLQGFVHHNINTTVTHKMNISTTQLNLNPSYSGTADSTHFDGIKITKLMDTTPNANDNFRVHILATPVLST